MKSSLFVCWIGFEDCWGVFISTLLQQLGASHPDSSTGSGYSVLFYTDLILQTGVSWRRHPPSSSLMDWKRFTHKSNKPGGRPPEQQTHQHVLASWKLVLMLRVKKQAACLGTSLSPHLDWHQQACWVKSHWFSLACESLSRMRCLILESLIQRLSLSVKSSEKIHLYPGPLKQ